MEMIVEAWMVQGLDGRLVSFPRVCEELWEDFTNSLPFFFNFCRDLILVSLERRSGECG